MRFNKERIQRVKDALFKKPYIFYFIFIFLTYIGINILINQTFVTLPVIFNLYRKKFLIPFLFFNFLLLPSLIALTINLSIIKFKESKALNTKKGGGFTFLGIFGGFLGGACPGCFVGLFPAFLGLFGVTASLSVLPLYGLEIQMVSIVFLLVAIVLLTRNIVCEVPIKEINKGKIKLKKK